MSDKMKPQMDTLNNRIAETASERNEAITKRDTVIKAAFASANPEEAMQFEEQAHSQPSGKANSRLDASNKTYVKRLEELGIKTDADNPLAKAMNQAKTRRQNRLRVLLGLK